MNNLRQAAQQALEGLKQAKDAVSEWSRYASEYSQQKYDLQGDLDAIQSQITSLRAALAEPEQEPVAFVHINGTSDTKLHLAPRKPLTDEVIAALWSWAQSKQAEATATTQQHAFARAIEAAHGIGEQI